MEELTPFFNHPVQRSLPTYILVGIALAAFCMMMEQKAANPKIMKVYEIYKDLPGVTSDCHLLEEFFSKSRRDINIHSDANFLLEKYLIGSFLCSLLAFACFGEFRPDIPAILQRFSTVVLILICIFECIFGKMEYAIFFYTRLILICFITTVCIRELILTVTYLRRFVFSD